MKSHRRALKDDARMRFLLLQPQWIPNCLQKVSYWPRRTLGAPFGADYEVQSAAGNRFVVAEIVLLRNEDAKTQGRIHKRFDAATGH